MEGSKLKDKTLNGDVWVLILLMVAIKTDLQHAGELDLYCTVLIIMNPTESLRISCTMKEIKLIMDDTK